MDLTSRPVKPRIMYPPPWGGDERERTWWPRVGREFPAFEQLWSEVITHLTSRPLSLSLRRDLPRRWAEAAERHYSVFSHLADAHDKLDRCGAALHGAADVYTALVAALNNALGLLDALGERGVLGHAPHFTAVNRRIRDVRNPVHHEALKARISVGGKTYVLLTRIEVYERYPTWEAVDRVTRDPVAFSRDFLEEGALASDDLEETLAGLNELWTELWERRGPGIVALLSREVLDNPLIVAADTSLLPVFESVGSTVPLSSVTTSTTDFRGYVTSVGLGGEVRMIGEDKAADHPSTSGDPPDSASEREAMPRKDA